MYSVTHCRFRQGKTGYKEVPFGADLCVIKYWIFVCVCVKSHVLHVPTHTFSSIAVVAPPLIKCLHTMSVRGAIFRELQANMQNNSSILRPGATEDKTLPKVISTHINTEVAITDYYTSFIEFQCYCQPYL